MSQKIAMWHRGHSYHKILDIFLKFSTMSLPLPHPTFKIRPIPNAPFSKVLKPHFNFLLFFNISIVTHILSLFRFVDPISLYHQTFTQFPLDILLKVWYNTIRQSAKCVYRIYTFSLDNTLRDYILKILYYYPIYSLRGHFQKHRSQAKNRTSNFNFRRVGVVKLENAS